MGNYASICGKWVLLSDDPAKALTEATNIENLSGIPTNTQINTQIQNTDSTVALDIVNP